MRFIPLRGLGNGLLRKLDSRLLLARALQDASTQHQDLRIVGRQGQRCVGFLVSLGKAVVEIKCASPQVMIVGGFRFRNQDQDLRRFAGCKICQSKLVTDLDIFRTEEVGGAEVNRGITGLSIPEEKLAEGSVPLEIGAEM